MALSCEHGINFRVPSKVGNNFQVLRLPYFMMKKPEKHTSKSLLKKIRNNHYEFLIRIKFCYSINILYNETRENMQHLSKPLQKIENQIRNTNKVQRTYFRPCDIEGLFPESGVRRDTNRSIVEHESLR